MVSVSVERLAECVPNVSLACEPAVLREMGDAAGRAGAFLLDTHSDGGHNRSVLTLAGGLPAIRSAVLAIAEIAVARIDLRHHRGAHPRVGALDVVPIVPLGSLPSSECVQEARTVGARIWQSLAVPVYFYGNAALDPGRERLETVRKFGFERLAELVGEGKFLPDVGGPALHPSAGACFVGVRGPLVALNVVLAGCGLVEARRIAAQTRESGGGLQGVKALGLRPEPGGAVQVSMNITRPLATPVSTVIKFVRARAAAMGATVLESELVGLAPRASLGSSPARLGIRGFRQSMVLEERLKVAGWRGRIGDSRS